MNKHVKRSLLYFLFSIVLCCNERCWQETGILKSQKHVAIYNAMAEGIESAVGKEGQLTFHPEGESNSADYFHREPWLDFNMVQSGHRTRSFPIDNMIAVNRRFSLVFNKMIKMKSCTYVLLLYF